MGRKVSTVVSGRTVGGAMVALFSLWAFAPPGAFLPNLHAQVPGPNINVISGVENQFRGDKFLQRQNEPMVAASARNSRHLLATANDYRPVDFQGDIDSATTPSAAEAWCGVYRSYDFGRHWLGGLYPGFPEDISPAGLSSPLKGLSACADPVMTAGTSGHFYVGGLAFDRGGTSRVFIGRFVDKNDGANKDSILYEFTTIIDQGQNASNGQFMDKPSIAFDIPRAEGSGPDAPGSVYFAYSRFEGQEKDGSFRTGIYFVRSVDGAKTFSSPLKISNPFNRGQGTAIGIDPNDGTIYVVWREFNINGSGDYMAMASSKDGGQSFGKSFRVTKDNIQAYDQPTLGVDSGYPLTARSNGYPTIAVDNAGQIFVAWQERVGGIPAIVFTRGSEEGDSWSTRQVAESSPYGQLMPVLSYGGGVLRLLFYDYRPIPGDDGVYPPGVDPLTGFLSGLDRRAHVRVAQLNSSGFFFNPSVQVSQYLQAPGTTNPPRIFETAPGWQAVSRPNLPMYRGGRTPFFGDYISIAPAVQFIRNEGAGGGLPWRWASLPDDTSAQTSVAVWTDHRDVVRPYDGNWRNYNPEECINSGSRNSNIYFAEISNGVVATSSQTYLDLTTEEEQTYIVSVSNRNGGEPSRYFRLSLETDDPGLELSFVQTPDPDLRKSQTYVEILRFSTVTYPVFAYCEGCQATSTFSLNVDELDDSGSGEKPNGIKTSLAFNTDPLNPQISSPQISSPQISSPQISSPQISSPQISSPQISSPQISSPQISSPQISSGSIEEIKDYTWTLTNNGETEVPFSVLSSIQNLDDLIAAGYQFQLIVYNNVLVPVPTLADGNVCEETAELELNEVVSNIVDPEAFSTPQISNPQISNPQISSPQISSPQISNATFSIEPSNLTPSGDDGTDRAPRKTNPTKVTLRVFKFKNTPGETQAAGTSTGTGTPEFRIGRMNQTIVSQVADEDGNYAYSATLAITTQSLPGGSVGSTYSETTLAALGGTPDYNWSVSSGSLPPGLTLSSGGIISGCPSQAGTFSFTIMVTDISEPQQAYEKDFTVVIAETKTTATTLTSSKNPSFFGDSVTFTATVKTNPPSCGTSTPASVPVTRGKVTFKDGANVLATQPLNGSGIAQFTTSGLSVGTHTITAEYSDNASPAYFDTSSASVNQQVLYRLEITTGSLPGGTLGNIYSKTVEARGGTLPYSWSKPSGSLPPGLSLSLVDGIISGCPVETGSYSFKIKVTDVSVPQQVDEKDFTVVIAQTKTTATTITSSKNPSFLGESVTFTATVKTRPSSCGTPVPVGGKVTFRDGSAVLATLDLDGSGTAKFTTSGLSAGIHTITAEYSDNPGAYFDPSSASVSQQVIYKFTGFYSPLGPINGTYGPVKSGNALPVKWEIYDVAGNPIRDIGTFKSLIVVPSAGIPVAAKGSMQMTAAGQYVFSWDTSGLAGECKLTLMLADEYPRTVTVILK